MGLSNSKTDSVTYKVIFIIYAYEKIITQGCYIGRAFRYCGSHAVEHIQYLNSIDPKRVILDGDFYVYYYSRNNLVQEKIP